MEELVAEAYDLVAKILERARDALNADAEVADTQRILRETAMCLEDIEAFALLAGAPGRDAEATIERRLVRLHELSESLELDQEP